LLSGGVRRRRGERLRVARIHGEHSRAARPADDIHRLRDGCWYPSGGYSHPLYQTDGCTHRLPDERLVRLAGYRREPQAGSWRPRGDSRELHRAGSREQRPDG